MRKIEVSTHTINRWKERVGTDIDKHYIKQLFKNNNMVVLEAARHGCSIVQVKDFVFVISRTNTRTQVHTTYGRAEDYDIKRPEAIYCVNDAAFIKWQKQQHIELHRRNKNL